MGALDELDLSKKLSKEEEAERLEAAWTRLTQLRLTLGGLIGSGELGPPVCVPSANWIQLTPESSERIAVPPRSDIQ